MQASPIEWAAALKHWAEGKLLERRWRKLQAMGMFIGRDVWLPEDTWIDVPHCNLISIGDHCGFGSGCMILAHDAQMDEFLDASRVGRVIIHESSHIGARTIILPGVEVGPRTIVGAGSLVSKSLPPETVCAGSPAKVVCSLGEYLDKHRRRLETAPKFDWKHYVRDVSPDRSAELVAAVRSQDVYIVGGRVAELRGEGGTRRTK